jgi:galactofuranose transport system substrate-binding protein
VGTPEYMAPEQWTGQVTAASDIYSLGVVFYEMVTGRKPYTADTPAAVLIKQTNDPLPGPAQFVPGLPGDVEKVLFKALAKKPEDRYQSMGEFASGLERLLMRPESSAQPVPAPAATATMLVPAGSPAQAGPRAAVQEGAGDEMKTTLALPNQAAGQIQPPVLLKQAGLAPDLNPKKKPWWPWAAGLAGILGLALIGIFVLVRLGLSAAPVPTATEVFLPTEMPTEVLPSAVPATAVPVATTVPAATIPAATIVPGAVGAAKCAPNCAYKEMVLCYPQLGAESDWRTANSTSFTQTAADRGITLIFSDARQNQENQLSAVRSCIAQGVNVIALPPVVETGWDAVLQEARAANIPVIIVDRTVAADPSLYAAHIGSDMVIEGQRAAAEFNKLLPNGGTILELSGSSGSNAAFGRAKGFRDALNANIKILDSQTGNFNQNEARPVMEAFLEKYPGQFQGVFFQNDDMAVGAVQAIQAAGIKPGDLKMVAIDGSRAGFQLLIDGWLQADVECSPMLGPQVMDLALKLMNGQPILHEVIADESVFYPDNAASLLPTRKY